MIIQDKIYGKIKIEDPLAVDLIKSRSLQRLKGVYCNGVYVMSHPNANQNKFEHSVGVYYLLTKYSKNRLKQIAGLIHDVSHPAFSHVIDFIENRAKSQDYQEKIFESYLYKTEIPCILRKHGVEVSDISDLKKFPLLEKPSPALCADRIDYLFHDGIRVDVVTSKSAKQILKALRVKNKRWYFNDVENARKYAQRYLQMNRKIWAGKWNVLSHKLLAMALKRSFDKKIISRQDLFRFTDEALWKRIAAAKDDIISMQLHRIKNIYRIPMKESSDDYDLALHAKCRIIDPLIMDKGKLKKLSSVDIGYKKVLKKEKQRVKKGWKIKFL